MAKSQEPPTICELCITARDDPIFRYPRHLVHPVTGEDMLFEARGEAICPTCGARYRRTLNVIALLG